MIGDEPPATSCAYRLTDSPTHRLLLASFLAVVLAMGSGAIHSTRAGIELGQAGLVGSHGLTDFRESPGATCRFAPPLSWSLGETWIDVRPPVMFARDVTEEGDEQLVGWRAVILGWDRASGAWRPAAEGGTQRAIASEYMAAPFDHRGPETRFFLPYDVYVVTTELFWYERMGPEDEPRLAGQAQYQVEHYAIAVRDRGGTQPIGVSSRCQLEL